jgi:type VI secretion system FHA domain protein
MMLLTLSVISAQGASLGNSAYRVFDAQGGTIGRIDANDWVLPDAAKFVSSHHARIRCHNNTFYLQDLSTNGTFLNSTDTPVSKSDLTALGDGDRILIGDYEILVQLIDDGSSAAPEPEPAPPPAPAAPAAWPIQSPVAASADPLVPDEPPIETADPLLLLGGGAPTPARAAPLVPPVPQPAPRAPAPSPPPPPPQTSALPPPTPAAGIPDDWQLTGFNMPTPAARAAPAASPAPPASPASLASTLPPARAPQPAPPAPQPAPPAPANWHAATLPPATPRPATLPVTPRAAPGMPDDRIGALFAGLGVDPDRVSPETFTELGEILRIVVQGMIDVLQSRSEVKNNFRVPMTTMRPVENNPLKFSMNVEDAIHNLFVKRNPGYLQPVDAFREGFRDVAYHQVAMLAGIRTAFNALIARFDPETLQETYERKLKRTMLLGVANKLKYWDLYCEQFEEFDKDAESTFQNLFGEEFAKAYFEQLQQLATTARLRKR